ILKGTVAGVLAYCPDCRAYPQPKFGHYTQGEISCSCHATRVELIEREAPLMEITIDRKPHGSNMGVALTVIATYTDKYPHRQFKIDVRSEKNSGNYQMRLDGLGYLQSWDADALKPLLQRLADTNEFDAAQEALDVLKTEDATRTAVERPTLPALEKW